jgi:hypothetical protein
VASSGEVLGQVDWHRRAVVRDQDEAICIAPDQELRIQRSAVWCTGFANAPDDQVTSPAPETSEQHRADVLVEQVA